MLDSFQDCLQRGFPEIPPHKGLGFSTLLAQSAGTVFSTAGHRQGINEGPYSIQRFSLMFLL